MNRRIKVQYLIARHTTYMHLRCRWQSMNTIFLKLKEQKKKKGFAHKLLLLFTTYLWQTLPKRQIPNKTVFMLQWLITCLLTEISVFLLSVLHSGERGCWGGVWSLFPPGSIAMELPVNKSFITQAHLCSY